MLALLVAIGLFGGVQATRFLSSDHWVEHTNQVIQVIEASLFRVQAAESSQRGYSSTGREDFLPPYEAAAALLPERLAVLRKLIADNPEQAARCARFAAAIDEKLAVTRERIDQRRAPRRRRARTPVHGWPGPPARWESHRHRPGDDRRRTNPPARRGPRRAAAGLRNAETAFTASLVFCAGLLVGGFVLTRRELRRRQALGGTLAKTNADLAAEIAERRRAQQHLQAQHAVAGVAAESLSLDEAAPRFLEAICTHLHWQLGESVDAGPRGRRPAFGRVLAPAGEPADAEDRAGCNFRRRQPGAADSPPARGCRAASGRRRAALGGRPVGGRDLPARRSSPREAGLRRAFALPVRAGDREQAQPG